MDYLVCPAATSILGFSDEWGLYDEMMRWGRYLSCGSLLPRNHVFFLFWFQHLGHNKGNKLDFGSFRRSFTRNLAEEPQCEILLSIVVLTVQVWLEPWFLCVLLTLDEGQITFRSSVIWKSQVRSPHYLRPEHGSRSVIFLALLYGFPLRSPNIVVIFYDLEHWISQGRSLTVDLASKNSEVESVRLPNVHRYTNYLFGIATTPPRQPPDMPFVFFHVMP